MNNPQDEKLALGCYGSPLIYDPGHQVCSTCPHRESCGPKAKVRLAVLHGHYGITPKMTVSAPPAPTTAAASASAGIRRALARGLNPLKETAPQRWLRLAFDMVISNDGKLAPSDLTTAFVDKLGEPQDQAAQLAKRAVDMMTTAGAITIADERISIRRQA